MKIIDYKFIPKGILNDIEFPLLAKAVLEKFIRCHGMSVKNGHGYNVFITYSKLMQDTGASEEEVKSAINYLIKKGLLSMSGESGNVSYRVNTEKVKAWGKTIDAEEDGARKKRPKMSFDELDTCFGRYYNDRGFNFSLEASRGLLKNINYQFIVNQHFSIEALDKKLSNKEMYPTFGAFTEKCTKMAKFLKATQDGNIAISEDDYIEASNHLKTAFDNYKINYGVTNITLEQATKVNLAPAQTFG